MTKSPSKTKYPVILAGTGSQPYSLVHHQKRNSQTYFFAVENYMGVPDVCAWPNLLGLKDGTLLVFLFNQPCHGRWEGDVDCWASEDDGKTWRFRGRPAPHEPGANRMNTTSGIAANGDLIVVAGGFSQRPPSGTPNKNFAGCGLRPWICRSPDSGRTWKQDVDTWLAHKSGDFFCPYGIMAGGADGSLCVAAYTHGSSYLLRSRDDGRTWGEPALINSEKGSETAVLHLGNGRWLAVDRMETAMRGRITGSEWNDDHLELFRSEDDGRTWRHAMPLSLPHQLPAHLLRLQDGRILLTYGNRCLNNCGVDARFSEDEGETWSPPIRIGPADLSSTDCGYPSSVELPDDRVVTVYYHSRNSVRGRDRDPEFTANQARQTPDNQLELHYELRVSRWNPKDF